MKAGRLVRNDRLIGVSAFSKQFSHISNLDQMGAGFVDGMSQFWVTYNLLDGGSFRVVRTVDGAGAVKIIRDADRTARP